MFTGLFPQCIDFADKDQVLEIEVGTIVVATGVDVYDPRPLPN